VKPATGGTIAKPGYGSTPIPQEYLEMPPHVLYARAAALGVPANLPVTPRLVANLEALRPPPHLYGRKAKKWIAKARGKVIAREERLRERYLAKQAKLKEKAALKGKRPLYYVLDVAATNEAQQVVIELFRRPRKIEGEKEPGLKAWSPQHAAGKPKLIANPEDRELIELLEQASGEGASAFSMLSSTSTTSSKTEETEPGETTRKRGRYAIGVAEQAASILDRLARTGRFRLRHPDDVKDGREPAPMRWEDNEPWRFRLDARQEIGGGRWIWRGSVRKGDVRVDLTEPVIMLPGIVVLPGGRGGRFDDAGIFFWLLRLRHEKEMLLTQQQNDSMLGKLLAEAKVPARELLESLELKEVDLPPKPRLILRTPRYGRPGDNLLANCRSTTTARSCRCCRQDGSRCKPRKNGSSAATKLKKKPPWCCLRNSGLRNPRIIVWNRVPANCRPNGCRLWPRNWSSAAG
jgi:hypothetical protein